jgi:hypothetical protein
MKAAKATVAAMIQGLTRGFHCAPGAKLWGWAAGAAIEVGEAGPGDAGSESGKNYSLILLKYADLLPANALARSV